MTSRPRRATALPIVVAAAALLLGAPTTASAKTGRLDLGLQDPAFSSGNADTRARWLDTAQTARARTITFTAHWRGIASAQPAAPTDPSDPAYDWRRLDNQVRDATAHGFQVLIQIVRAPDWAEGPNRSPDAPPGTWKPDPAKLAQFATATATRYSGTYPDPLNPEASLPRVRDWQVWAEQNIVEHLSPQLDANGKPASPDHYRRMLNAAYKAIKAVSPDNRVVAGSTAPFERRPVRIGPRRFWREVLCLKGRKLRKARCSGPPAHLDVLAHNPLSWFVQGKGSSPWVPARKFARRDDVVVPDMHELGRLVRKARARGTVKPRRRQQLWATELLWESNPPDATYGVPLERQAEWLADALYLLWRQGVSRVIWIKIVDPSSAGGLHSGLYLADETEKPALTAYRFPFVSVRAKGKTKVWGRAPASGRVEVQRARGGKWKTIKRLRTRRSNVFTGKVPGGRNVRLRAAIGSETSLGRKPR